MPTKTRILKKAIEQKKNVCFVAKTPTSDRGATTQCVMLRNAHVHRSKAGNDLITGRDIQLEILGFGKVNHENPVIRTFRIDRIINNTIMTK